MSKEEQLRVGQFIEKYLSIRENIKLIVLILDIRHKPTEDDKLMYNYIKSTNIPFIIIANKADKIAVTKVDTAVEEIKKEFLTVLLLTFYYIHILVNQQNKISHPYYKSLFV